MRRPVLVIGVIIAILAVALWGASRPPENKNGNGEPDISFDGGPSDTPAGDKVTDPQAGSDVAGSSTDQPAGSGSGGATGPVTGDVAAANGWVTPYRPAAGSASVVQPSAAVQPQPGSSVQPAGPGETGTTGGNGGGESSQPGRTPTKPATVKVFNQPLISIEFDDNWLSAYKKGLPLVESFGWKATINVYSESVSGNYEGYMSTAQLQDALARGHELAAHSVTHADLTKLHSHDRIKELSDSKQFVEDLTGEAATYFVTPYCAVNEDVTKDILAAGYTAIRNCDDKGLNTRTAFEITDIQSYNVQRSDSLEKIQGLIAEAKAKNAWLVLVYHEVRDDGHDHSVSSNALKHQLQTIKDSGVEVVVTSEVLAELPAR